MWAGLLANELCEFGPWCARKLVRWSAFRRYTDPGRAEMRAEELTALINDRPGNLFKLITAVCFAADAIIVCGRRAIVREPDVGRGSNPADLIRLAMAARSRGLYRHAAQLFKNGVAQADAHAGANLINLLHDLHPADHEPAQWVVTHVALDAPYDVDYLLEGLRKAAVIRPPASPPDDPYRSYVDVLS